MPEEPEKAYGNRALARRVSPHPGVKLRDIGPVPVAVREALLAIAIDARR